MKFMIRVYTHAIVNRCTKFYSKGLTMRLICFFAVIVLLTVTQVAYAQSDVVPQGGSTNEQPTFDCAAGKSYLFQGDGDATTLNSKTGVYEFNILQGTIKEVKSQLIPNWLDPDNRTAVNNVGYNVKDDYMWGYRRGTSQLVRIGSDWSVKLFSIDNLPSNVPYNSGDIDNNGIMYLYYGKEDGSPSTIKRVDLSTKTLLSDLNLTSSRNIRFMIDMAFNPVDGYLYGVDGSSDNNGNNNYECHLYRINKSTGAATDMGNVGITGNRYPFGAAYFDNEGTLFLSQNLTGKIYKIKNVSTGGKTAVFVKDGPKTNDNDGARCPNSPIFPNISGTVFNDANGLVDNTVNGNPVSTLAGNTLYVNLVKGGKVVATTTLTSGTYSFTGLTSNTSYTLVLSNKAGTVGSAPPNTALSNGVYNTGENIGSGTGNDGTPNGIIVVALTDEDSDDVNFGLNTIPVADAKTAANQANPGGTVKVKVPVLTGSDLEDGTYTGISKTNTIVIKSLPVDGTLYYDNVAVTVGQVITNYDPDKLTVDPKDGQVTVSFTYSERDAAKKESTPAEVKMPFTLVPDLVPILQVKPSTVYGIATNMTVVADIYELRGVNTKGTITVRITKDGLLSLNFDPNAETIGGRSVQNNKWTFDNTNDSYYIFKTKTNEVITGGNVLSFGLTGTLNPKNTTGTLTVSAVIVGGSGGEVKMDNNSDAEKVDYFQK